MVKTRLKDLREDHDLLQKNLAEMLNIAQTTYSQYELSKREVPYEIIIKLASFYNTSVDYILYLTDDKKPYKRKERS
ncbi:MAG: helix-turn-helix transcriptional regulator [Clostridia bacterium]|nr:helix-turn-helix transcriptional regulator [Clostridia bacterium]